MKRAFVIGFFSLACANAYANTVTTVPTLENELKLEMNMIKGETNNVGLNLTPQTDAELEELLSSTASSATLSQSDRELEELELTAKDLELDVTPADAHDRAMEQEEKNLLNYAQKELGPESSHLASEIVQNLEEVDGQLDAVDAASDDHVGTINSAPEQNNYRSIDLSPIEVAPAIHY